MTSAMTNSAKAITTRPITAATIICLAELILFESPPAVTYIRPPTIMMITAAKAEIEQEVSRAKDTLRAQVAVLAVKGAEKILRREVDAKAHAELLNAVASEL